MSSNKHQSVSALRSYSMDFESSQTIVCYVNNNAIVLQT